jgi:hypothetical protein
MRWSRWLVACLAGSSLALVALASGLLVAERLGPERAWLFAGLSGVGVLAVALGVIVTWRVRRNLVGPLLTWVGFDVVFVAAREVYYRAWLTDPEGIPLSTPAIAVLDESAWWLLAAVALLLLYFPDGRLPSRRWRVVAALVFASALVTHLTSLGASEPFIAPMQDRPRPWGPFPWPVLLLGLAANAALVVLVVVAASSTVLRFRRATGRARAQLKWLSLAGLGIALYPVVCLTELVLTGGTGRLAVIVGVVSLVMLPVSVAMALLRHDLYDVDRVLADTISYVAVVTALVAAYATFSLALGLLVGRGSAAAAAGATALCGLILGPLRVRLRRTIDRRLFPRHRAAAVAVADLQHRVHAEGAQPEELESVLRTALRDPTLRVGLLVPGASASSIRRATRSRTPGSSPSCWVASRSAFSRAPRRAQAFYAASRHRVRASWRSPGCVPSWPGPCGMRRRAGPD